MFYLNVFQANCEEISDVETKVELDNKQFKLSKEGWYVMDGDVASVKSNLIFQL